MTKKTNEANDNAATDVGVDTAAASVNVEHPKTGGSFTRQADGSLVPNETDASPAEAPGCHFDVKPEAKA